MLDLSPILPKPIIPNLHDNASNLYNPIIQKIFFLCQHLKQKFFLLLLKKTSSSYIRQRITNTSSFTGNFKKICLNYIFLIFLKSHSRFLIYINKSFFLFLPKIYPTLEKTTNTRSMITPQIFTNLYSTKKK